MDDLEESLRTRREKFIRKFAGIINVAPLFTAVDRADAHEIKDSGEAVDASSASCAIKAGKCGQSNSGRGSIWRSILSV